MAADLKYVAAGLKYVAAGHKYVAAGLKYVAAAPTRNSIKTGHFWRVKQKFGSISIKTMILLPKKRHYINNFLLSNSAKLELNFSELSWIDKNTQQ